MLDVGISVSLQCHGIIYINIRSVGFFPPVGHTVAVGVSGGCTGPKVPCVGCAYVECALVADNLASESPRAQIADEHPVEVVAIRQ